MLNRILVGGLRRAVIPLIVKREIRREQRFEESIVVKNFPGGETEPLTIEEIQQVRRLWGGDKL